MKVKDMKKGLLVKLLDPKDICITSFSPGDKVHLEREHSPNIWITREGGYMVRSQDVAEVIRFTERLAELCKKIKNLGRNHA